MTKWIKFYRAVLYDLKKEGLIGYSIVIEELD